ncbi:MAG: 30S ribosomal protein S8 [bacterium]
MAVTDPIADMLTVIRNGCKAKQKKVEVPASRVKTEILKVLLREKFISNFRYIEDDKQGRLRIYLKYTESEASVITGLKRVSRPGLRIYRPADRLPSVRGGLGLAILSTSQGVMTGADAGKRRIGGEVVCNVW